MLDARHAITFGLAGPRPAPKGSVRVFNGHVIHSSKSKHYETLVADAARAAVPDGWDMEAPAAVDLSFSLVAPKALHPKLRRGVVVAHVKRPDIDKLARTVLDALTGICWSDDSQVHALTVRKFYVLDAPTLQVVVRRQPPEDQ